MYTDSHCHLGDIEGGVAAAVLDARAAGVTTIVNVATDLQSSRQSVEIAEAHEGVFATVGIHPHEAVSADGPAIAELTKLAGHPKVVAIGEIGLDYFRDRSPRDAQRRALAAQLQLAAGLGKTVMLHVRDAFDDLFEVLDEQGVPSRLVFHCFSGGAATAAKAVEAGGYVSFAGNVSFKNAQELREAAASVPAGRLLIETDAPYLAPVPNRGKQNRPAWVVLTAAAVAEARGAPVEAIAQLTSQNAKEVFGLADLPAR